jgi:hypothetical protein
VEVDDHAITDASTDHLRTDRLDNADTAVTDDGRLVDGNARHQNLVNARVAGLRGLRTHQNLASAQWTNHQRFDGRHVRAVFHEGTKPSSSLVIRENRWRAALGLQTSAAEQSRATADGGCASSLQNASPRDAGTCCHLHSVS